MSRPVPHKPGPFTDPDHPANLMAASDVRDRAIEAGADPVDALAEYRETCGQPVAHYRRRCVCDPDLLDHEQGCPTTL